jgi:CrcB protein
MGFAKSGARIDNCALARHGSLMTLLFVAAGGALGATLRYLVGLTVPFPFGTLTVNIVGSFAMGLCLILLVDKGLDRWQPLVMTGLLGGFTTFSAFSLDTVRLWEGGQGVFAVGYVLASVLLSLAAIIVAILIARNLGL